MKSGELAELLNVSENSMKAHWVRFCKAQEKQGVFLYKLGRGENAEYGVKFPWESDVVWNVDELEII